jgi:hypothetical protein
MPATTMLDAGAPGDLLRRTRVLTAGVAFGALFQNRIRADLSGTVADHAGKLSRAIASGATNQALQAAPADAPRWRGWRARRSSRA